jgi:hypothetical protein
VLASLVERHLTDGGVLVEDETLTGFEVVLETGTDFTTVEQAPRPESTTTSSTDDTGDEVSSDTSDDDSDDESSSVDATASTTSTTIIGRTPGEVPEGVECG